MNESMDERHSDAYLNAFLDGELAADERERALRRLDSDEAFKRRVCELRGLKERVRAAYADLPAAPARHGMRRMAPVWRQALAAGVLLVMGLTGGWLARDSRPDEAVYDRLTGLPQGYRPVSLAGQVDPDKIVLHLDSNDPARLTTVLDLAERLLASRGERGEVEVVVNSYGLNLLRQGVSPHKERIARMAALHRNLAFVACGQSIARLSRDGEVVDLLPQARVARTAIGEILERMQQGWVYVKV